MQWEPVIGLELHTRLATRSKIFSAAPTAYGAAPNTQACAVDLGLPGVLPVLNQEVMRMAVMFGLAVHATIAKRSVFARKNYFYPDLPKGYQISQYELPIVSNGHIDITDEHNQVQRIGITRAHLEEDAGKSIHDAIPGSTGIDLNRAGTPLIEIVSEPELRSAAQAVAYMKKIHAIVRYLEICDGNMQEGSFRCDANVSIRPRGATELGTRTELKNLNSFRFVERAINFEIARQIEALDSGIPVVQETRLYDAYADETRPMRGKEEANDYRYFPDPDLLPVELSDSFIESIATSLPELPDAKHERFTKVHGLSDYDASQLTMSRALAEYFEAATRAAGGDSKSTANWITGELSAYLNREDRDIEASPVEPEMLGGLIRRIADGTLSNKIAKDVFEAMWAGDGDADQIIDTRGLRQMTDAATIEAFVDDVLAASPMQVEQYRAGRGKVLGYLVGQVMKASSGKANPKQVTDMLRAKLDA